MKKAKWQPLVGIGEEDQADMKIADLLTFTNASKGRWWSGSEEQYFVRASFCPH
jgi:hypothetical protein